MGQRIGLWGFYAEENFGDDMLLLQLVDHVKRLTENPEIYVFGGSAAQDADGLRFLPRTVKASLRMAFSLDVLIIGPGGLLPNRAPGKILFFIMLALIMRIRRRRVGVIGLGVGMANGKSRIGRFLLNVLFGAASTVLLRHGPDARLRLWPCNRARVKTTLDYLMSRPDWRANPPTQRGAGKKQAVFALADLFDGHAHERDRFMDEIVRVIKALHEKDVGVTLVALSRRADGALIARIARQIGEGAVRCLTYRQDADEEILGALSQAAVVVAMRFHALVLALRFARPVYTIAYSEKLEYLCRWAGCERHIQRVCFDERLYYETYIPLDGERLLAGVRELLDAPRQQIAAAQMDEAQREAERAYGDALRALL